MTRLDGRGRGDRLSTDETLPLSIFIVAHARAFARGKGQRVFSEDDVEKALPPQGFLREYVTYAKNCTDAHSGYHLGPGLTALAQTCPADLSFTFDGPIYGNVYTLLVGPSAEARKSASIGIARRLLGEVVPAQLVAPPASPEALVDSFSANARQVIIFSEFGAFLASAERRGGQMNQLKTAYTDAWEGNPVGRSTVRRQQPVIANPRLSIMAGCTLDYLERYTEPSDWTGGFMGRFLTFYAEKRARNYDRPPGDPARKALLIMSLQKHNEQNERVFHPRDDCLGFDARTVQLWSAWCREVERCAKDSPPEVRAAIARSDAHTRKIALLLAWDYNAGVRSGQPWFLTEAELAPACAITRLHIDSVREIGGCLATTRDMRDRRTVLAAIRATPRGIGEIIRDSKLLLKRVREILETLMTEGVVTTASLGSREAYVLAKQTEPTRDNVLQLPLNRSLSSGGPNGTVPSAAPLSPTSPAAAPGAAPAPLTWEDPKDPTAGGGGS